MYLKRLEIQGFKSFARKAVLEFEPGITAIVGPNGSGKSNVSDAVRWVLGEQSAKLMRGKKSDDVIFAGSDKKTRLGFAEVFATFDNSDHRIPVDSAEVSIGRRVDRSGESEYLINGNKVRLLDIIDLVLKSNIGTSRYTVIGQGTIDQMILSGPSEVKNLIDEASGVKTYYIKRDKTLKRLEQTAQNLMRAEDLILEIEPRLKSLRRQAKRMEARSSIETELKIYQREWYSAQYWQLAKTIEGKNKILLEATGRRKGLEEQLNLQLRRREDAETVNKLNFEKYSSLREEIRQVQSQKNRVLEQLSLLRGKMSAAKTAIAGDPKTLQVELHNLERNIKEIKDSIASFTEEESLSHKKLSELRELEKNASEELQKLSQALSQPQLLDTELFLKIVDNAKTAFEFFYENLSKSVSVSEVLSFAVEYKSKFEQFTEEAGNLASKPKAFHGMQEKLSGLLKNKDELTEQIKQLDIASARKKISREFLEQQLEETSGQYMHVELELKKATSGDTDAFWHSLLAEEKKIQDDEIKLSNEINGLEKSLKDFYEAETKWKDQSSDMEKRARVLQEEINQLRNAESAIEVEKAREDTQMETLLGEALQALGPDILTEIRKEEVVTQTSGLTEKISKLKSQLDLIGGVDELTLKEYEETEKRYNTLSDQVTDLRRGMEDLRQIIEELDEHIKGKFSEAFHSINEKFENYFRILFNGGRAQLALVRAQDEQREEDSGSEEEAETPGEKLRPEEKLVQKYERGSTNIVGVDMKATPPGKKLATIQALSGGERALTSIALLCSLLTCFPSPFVVLDEVDAALDDANTIRFGQILGTLSHQTQFVTITHNRETMSQSNILYGVTMGDDGISKLLSVKLEQAKAFAK